MKGSTIINGNALLLPIITGVILISAACFTIIADPRKAPPDVNSTIAGNEGAETSPVSQDLPQDQDSGRTFSLELIADPSESAAFAVDPRSNSQGGYPSGTEVAIHVSLQPGWKIEQWVGQVYGVSKGRAMIKMDQDQAVLVRVVQIDPTTTHHPASTDSP